MGSRGQKVKIAAKKSKFSLVEEPKKKNKLSELFEKRKAKDIEFFFGETKWKSKQYFRFDHVKDNDNIIIVTNNIKAIKGNFVMIVDNNKAVYLKDWQIKPVHNYTEEMSSWAVKLNRKYFKAYTFKSDFEGYSFDKQDTFDSLMEAAKSQNQNYIALDKHQLDTKIGFLSRWQP